MVTENKLKQQLDNPNSVTMKALEEAEKEENLSKKFSSVKELMQDLNY